MGIATQIDGEEEAAHRGLKRFVPRVLEPSVVGLVRYFTEMGAALRELAGQMGVAEVQELVGHADRLVQVSHRERLDLTSLLTGPRARHHLARRHPASSGLPPATPAPGPGGGRRAPRGRRRARGRGGGRHDADRNLGTDLGLIARATTGVNNAWVNGAGVSPTNGSDGADGEPDGAATATERPPRDAGGPRLHEGAAAGSGRRPSRSTACASASSAAPRTGSASAPSAARSRS